MNTELNWFCWNCHHMTEPIGVGVCRWCKSPKIGTANHPAGPLAQSRHMGRIAEPEDREPTKHQRLRDGFSMLQQCEL